MNKTAAVGDTDIRLAITDARLLEAWDKFAPSDLSEEEVRGVLRALKDIDFECAVLAYPSDLNIFTPYLSKSEACWFWCRNGVYRVCRLVRTKDGELVPDEYLRIAGSCQYGFLFVLALLGNAVLEDSGLSAACKQFQAKYVESSRRRACMDECRMSLISNLPDTWVSEATDLLNTHDENICRFVIPSPGCEMALRSDLTGVEMWADKKTGKYYIRSVRGSVTALEGDKDAYTGGCEVPLEVYCALRISLVKTVLIARHYSDRNYIEDGKRMRKKIENCSDKNDAAQQKLLYERCPWNSIFVYRGATTNGTPLLDNSDCAQFWRSSDGKLSMRTFRFNGDKVIHNRWIYVSEDDFCKLFCAAAKAEASVGSSLVHHSESNKQEAYNG